MKVYVFFHLLHFNDRRWSLVLETYLAINTVYIVVNQKQRLFFSLSAVHVPFVMAALPITEPLFAIL